MFFKRFSILSLMVAFLGTFGVVGVFAQQPGAPAPNAGGSNQSDPISNLFVGALSASLGKSDKSPAQPSAPRPFVEATPFSNAADADLNAKLLEANAGLDQMAAAQNAAAGTTPTSGSAISSEENANLSSRMSGYVGFWYENTLDEDAGTSDVQRLQMPGDEYEERRRNEVENVWYPRYSAFLNGNYAYAEPDIPEAMAQAMVQVDAETSNRMRSDPAFLEGLARRMSEWTVFYQQLDLWRTYVEEHVLREALTEEERPSFDPSVVETELPAVYDKLKTHAQTVSDREYQAYLEVMKDVDKTVRAHDDYQAWQNDRQRQMLDFAENWGAQHDGSQVSVGDTLYLVRPPKDKTAQPKAGEPEKLEYLPRNAVVIEVPKEKVVTPFDLINPNGTLKQPVER